MLTCLPDQEMRDGPICVPLRWPGVSRASRGLGASLRCLLLHPRGEASCCMLLPHEGKCKFVANIFQHLIFGLWWAVSSWGPVDRSYVDRGPCRVMSREVDALQNLTGVCVMASIQPQMLPAACCPGPGVCGLGGGYGAPAPAAGVRYLPQHRYEWQGQGVIHACLTWVLRGN